MLDAALAGGERQNGVISTITGQVSGGVLNLA